MAKDARKFRGTTPVTPLTTLKENIHTYTPGDRIRQFHDAMERVAAFHAKWNEIRKSGDKQKAEDYRSRVLSWVESARRARDELIRLGIDYKQYM
ncbi:MAG: hypothetical protein IKM94_03685 [Alphaproteobacteria bacterium]|nr:hypothetical protein [Alphaproteobacteria bacterium]